MTKWDQKAKNYSRYNEKKYSFEQNIFKSLANLNLDFKDKTLLDIGCGTGVYTIHLAKQCSFIHGIDSSKEMLKILQEDAHSINITNIKTTHTNWDNFTCKDKFDYAFCTMSPAIRTGNDLEKMDALGKTKIYLGWAGKRDTHIIETLFEAHNATYYPPNGAKKVKDWLTSKNKFYQVLKFDEKKIRKRELETSVQNFTWHLEVRGLKPNEKKIRKVLEKFKDAENFVTETTINHFNLIIW